MANFNSNSAAPSYRHGHVCGYKKSETYRSWVAIKRRCYNSTQRGFENYGGRGITLCERWHDFANFLADMGERPAGKTIDRINVNGNYEPENCRWSDKKTQTRNTRVSLRLTVGGVTKPISQWAEETGIDARKIRYRYWQGHTPEVCIALSPAPRKPRAVVNRRVQGRFSLAQDSLAKARRQ